MKIFLDDVRETPKGWARVFTVEELWQAYIFCIEYGEKIAEISLDNDLGDGIPEGYTFLDELEEKVFDDPSYIIPEKISIHSANPVARKRMQSVIERLYNK